MVVLLARYRVEPGHADDVEQALREMAPYVAKDEPGCLVYRATRSVEDPDVFVLFEEYENDAALAHHRTTEHFNMIIEGRVAPLLLSRERELLSPIGQPHNPAQRPPT